MGNRWKILCFLDGIQINLVFFVNLFPIQYPEPSNQMPIINETANYETPTVPSLESANNLAALNNLGSVPITENLLLLINALNCMKVGDGSNLNALQQQQQQQPHTCAINSFNDCSASTIGALSAGCTKKYPKSSVPADYMCHLCFSKDHFIRDCPQVIFVFFRLSHYISFTRTEKGSSKNYEKTAVCYKNSQISLKINFNE